MGKHRKNIEKGARALGYVVTGDEAASELIGKVAGVAFDPDNITKTADRMLGEPSKYDSSPEAYIERRDEKIEQILSEVTMPYTPG
ncbi:hypothetical protein ACFYYM_34190 [Streptomyces erythrochromogenes]|uniref:hypothetical protein n=1 Tax=Streptomyces TaxID=1883 RepID=UPI00363B27BC